MTLSVQRIVRASVTLAPTAPARREFGILNLCGDSEVLAPNEIRNYTSIEAVLNDFGLNTAEYKAAQAYFSQSPKPNRCMVSRWVRQNSKAVLIGSILSGANLSPATWAAITDGEFAFELDGTPYIIDEMDFTGVANLNAVAAVITNMIGAGLAVCIWDGSRFQITNQTTGAASTITFLTPKSGGTGTDISQMLGGTQTQGARVVNGMDAETFTAAVARAASLSSLWYGITPASSVRPTDTDMIEAAQLIEAFTVKRIIGLTETNPMVKDALFITDLASRASALGLTRTIIQYSSSNEFAVASLVGRLFSTNFNGNRTVITLMFKQEPSIAAEDLNDTEADTLKNKRCNVFAAYDNDTRIIQYGVMSGPLYADERHCFDWFENAVQNEIYTLAYTSTTKIPQTAEGTNMLKGAAVRVCTQADSKNGNGMIAGGVWNQDGFGTLKRGDFLPDGYYVFVGDINSQSQSDRDQRKAPPVQIALKMSGAFHEFDALITINR